MGKSFNYFERNSESLKIAPKIKFLFEIRNKLFRTFGLWTQDATPTSWKEQMDKMFSWLKPYFGRDVDSGDLGTILWKNVLLKLKAYFVPLIAHL